MSLFLDQKYLSLISNRLPLFKKKGDRLYNCRCIICGDSVKNKHKARGYFFEHKNELMYKCHNCNASMTLNNFIKRLDQVLYSQYRLEKYSEGAAVKTSNTIPFTFEAPKFKSQLEKLFDELLVSIDQLPDEHEAVKFCYSRSIPKEKFNKVFFVDNVKKLIKLNDKYSESIRGEEPRIVLPFYNEHGKLTAVTCRGIRGEALRYITIKLEENTQLLYGINDVDYNKTVYVVEGPIDSLFLDNCIAAAGTALNKVSLSCANEEKIVYIYDNQPRNNELVKIMEKHLDQGCNIVIWPQNIYEKDINEMVIAGKDVKKIVIQNTFSGLTAKMKFVGWKRV